jgi:Na+-translocating ferredoxin:NAD+ oxidoreductase RnfC subunit
MEHQPISRADAKAQGLKHYFTGALCKRKHLSPRWAKSSDCIQCQKDRVTAWIRNNPDQHKHQKKAAFCRYRDKDPSRRNAVARAWAADNREKSRSSSNKWKHKNLLYSRNASKEWRSANPDKVAIQRRRRQTQLSLTSFDHERDKMIEIYRNCPNTHEVDHIIPLNHPLVCGLHVVSNLQYLTRRENRSKSNHWAPDW